MAGKSEKGEKEPKGPASDWERLAKEIEGEYGEGVMVSGQEAADEYRQTIPVSPVFDSLIGGGIQEGSWVGLTGNAKHGKTSAALSFASNCQLEEFGARPIYYGKVEGRLSIQTLTGIEGLNLSSDRFNIIQSRKGRILSATDHLTIYSNILKTVPNAVLIIDSISALAEEKELAEGVGKETRGGGAKLFSQFCRLMNNVVPVHKSIVVGVTHLICNTSGMGAPLMERCPRMWNYQCDYQLRAMTKKPWEQNGRQVGLEIEWRCDTSALGPPGGRMTSFLRFGTGIDRVHEAFELGGALGLVSRKGNWFNLDFLVKSGMANEAPKFNGAAASCRAVRDNPGWRKALMEEVRVRYRSLGGDASE